LEKRKMKKFLIAGSSLAAVAAAGSAGAVDVTLGGSINMGIEYGLGKANQELQVGAAFNEVSLSINAAHTTDGGLVFGGGFTMGTADELEFNPYEPTAGDGAGEKWYIKRTVDGRTNIVADLYNVSGGGAVSSANVVSVKINSAWQGIDAEQVEYSLSVDAFTSSNLCKIAGKGTDGPYLAAKAVDAAVNTTKGNGAASISAGKAVVNVGTSAVTSAVAHQGPFMEVMMASSETKMVVGAACLTGVDSTETNFFMDNASKVMTVSDASIYIEGGFGKLTLQTGDYAGGVGAIAGAGDRADIDAGGLVVIAQGMGLMGANPYLAMDLAAGDTFGAFEVITGGTMDLGGLALGFDMALDNDATDPLDVFGVSAWDLGASYAMGDLSLAFATDSSSDWGLSASMAIAGFGVSTTFGSKGGDDHTKSGITYSVSASTALNGFGLAIGFDQDLQPTIGVDYDLGGLKLYAGYDAADEGGKVGATLSF
jgi:hypothetical protein